tara:strand:+ start:177 stop:467 length:291 start_codon:yes stop_codon:yes gene_type:complete
MKYQLRTLGLIIQILVYTYSTIWFIAIFITGSYIPGFILLLLISTLISYLGIWTKRKGQSILDDYKKCMDISLTQIRDQDFIDIQNQRLEKLEQIA